MVRRRALLTAASTALAATLAGCSDAIADTDGDTQNTTGTTSQPASTTTPTPTPERRVKLVSVSDVVENVSDETLAELVVTARFHDGAGTVLGTAGVDLSDMSPGRRWQFRIYFPESGEQAAVVADHSTDVSIEE